jgi:mannose-6-phosphate isomerase-like protein (cupin superfamily)
MPNTFEIPEKQGVGIQPVVGYAVNVDEVTMRNPYYRRVLYSHENGYQLAVMSLGPESSTGPDVYPHVDQFICVQCGAGIGRIGNNSFEVQNGSSMIVPAGTVFEVTNSSKGDPLKFFVIYSKPMFIPGQVDANKPIAYSM